MPKTSSPTRPNFHYTPCAGSAGYLAPNCYVGRVIQKLVMSIQELQRLAQAPAETSTPQCSACPAISLLDHAAQLIDDLNQFLDDLPAADCPEAATFNLSNVRPSLDQKEPH